MPNPKPLPIESYTRNLLDIWQEVTPEDYTRGIEWYRQANRYTVGIAALYSEFGITPDIVAAVIAALSPRVEWYSNVRGAWNLLHGILVDGLNVQEIQGVPGFRKNRQRAAKIVQELNPEAINTSPKTRAFCANIVNPESAEFITIDTWIVRAAFNVLDSTFQWSGLAGKRYKELESAIRIAADSAWVEPVFFQAGIWIAIQRLTKEFYTNKTEG